MNRFDGKWQACAERAGRAQEREIIAPFGFATRVVAIAMQRPTASPETVWERLALGSLAGVILLLVLCTAAEFPHLRDSQPLHPGVENAVAQVVWSL